MIGLHDKICTLARFHRASIYGATVRNKILRDAAVKKLNINKYCDMSGETASSGNIFPQNIELNFIKQDDVNNFVYEMERKQNLVLSILGCGNTGYNAIILCNYNTYGLPPKCEELGKYNIKIWVTIGDTYLLPCLSCDALIITKENQFQLAPSIKTSNDPYSRLQRLNEVVIDTQMKRTDILSSKVTRERLIEMYSWTLRGKHIVSSCELLPVKDKLCFICLKEFETNSLLQETIEPYIQLKCCSKGGLMHARCAESCFEETYVYHKFCPFCRNTKFKYDDMGRCLIRAMAEFCRNKVRNIVSE